MFRHYEPSNNFVPPERDPPIILYDETFTLVGGSNNRQARRDLLEDFLRSGLIPKDFERMGQRSVDFIEISWATDPNIYPQHYEIIRMIEGGGFEVLMMETKKLYRNTFKTRVILRPENGVAVLDENIEEIRSIIRKIQFIPLTFSLNFENGRKKKTQYVKEVDKIILSYCSEQTGMEVREIRITEHMGIITYIPYVEGENIYLTPEEQMRISFNFNAGDVYGYSLLSTNSLMIHTIDMYDRLDKTVLQPNYFKVYQNMILIKCDIHTSDLGSLIIDLKSFEDRLGSEGYFVLPNSSEMAFGSEININADRIKIYREIAIRWNGSVISDDFPIVIKSSIDFSTPTHVWYENSSDLILKGKLPVFRTYNHIAQSNSISLDRRAKLMFAAVKTYMMLIDKHPHLMTYFSSPYVYPDMSIEAAFSSYQEVIEYQDMIKYVIDELSVNSDRYSVISFDNLVDAIAFRSYFGDKYHDYDSLIIKPFERNQRYMVVFSSYIELNRKTVSNETIGIYRKELIKMLRSYYSLCNHPDQNISFEEMNLDSLLKLVPIYSPNDRVTGCFSSDLIDDRDLPFNPITKQPYSQETISTYKNLEWGLLGYFRVGNLKGLMDKPPMKSNKWMELGYIISEGISFRSEDAEEIMVDVSFYWDDLLNNSGKSYRRNPERFWHRLTRGTTDYQKPHLFEKDHPGYINSLFQIRLPNKGSKLYRQIIQTNKKIIGRVEVSDPSRDPRSSINRISGNPRGSNEMNLNVKGTSRISGNSRSNLETIRSLAENLWARGFFLNDWANSVYHETGKISQIPYKIPSTIRKGSDSIYDGCNSLVYMTVNEMILI